MVEGLQLLLLSQPAPPVRTPGLDGVDPLHILSRAMRSIAALTAAVLAAVVSPANAEKLKLRCESPLVPSASSTLYIDEVNGRITQIWDSDGQRDNNTATFKDGVWSWLVTIDGEAGVDISIDQSLDLRTGEVFAAMRWEGEPQTLEPTGTFCR